MYIKARFTRAIFVWQFLWDEFYLLVYMHEDICSDFMWQIHLPKNWSASFYVTNKNCQLRVFVRVYELVTYLSHVFIRTFAKLCAIIISLLKPIFCVE